VRVDELVVVASGCTDGTVRAAREVAEGDPRLKVVDEAERSGKLAAVRLFLSIARNDLTIISGGDTLPEPGAVQELCRPLLRDSGIGMAGPRVVPLEGREPGRRLHRVLWGLHHEVASRHPKLGEVVAVRRSAVQDLPLVSGCDEVIMEASVTAKSLTLAYASTAIVRNRGPATVSEYVAWRRRLAVMHYAAAEALGYSPSTMSIAGCFRASGRYLVNEPGDALWLVGCAGVEIVARVSGRRAYRRGDTAIVWSPTESSRDGAIARTSENFAELDAAPATSE
jgi:cellulose synthase/poly-beta-1,6-N-acetylglucosamine synthase-like glycosyltransferase